MSALERARARARETVDAENERNELFLVNSNDTNDIFTVQRGESERINYFVDGAFVPSYAEAERIIRARGAQTTSAQQRWQAAEQGIASFNAQHTTSAIVAERRHQRGYLFTVRMGSGRRLYNLHYLDPDEDQRMNAYYAQEDDVDLNEVPFPDNAPPILLQTLGHVRDLLTSNNKQACAICTVHFEPTDQLAALTCGHVFHPRCINEWIARNASCPECRAPIAHGSIRRIRMNQ